MKQWLTKKNVIIDTRYGGKIHDESQGFQRWIASYSFTIINEDVEA
jgi:hypothetical protein